MGFEKARKLLIRRLKSRNFDYHEERSEIWIKNKLYTKECKRRLRSKQNYEMH